MFLRYPSTHFNLGKLRQRELWLDTSTKFSVFVSAIGKNRDISWQLFGLTILMLRRWHFKLLWPQPEWSYRCPVAYAWRCGWKQLSATCTSILPVSKFDWQFYLNILLPMRPPRYYKNINVNSVAQRFFLNLMHLILPVATPVVLKGVKRPDPSFMTFLTE